jgi:septum site-determining protein MinC
MDEIVKIKGTRDGLTVLLDESADFRDLLRRLAERIADSNGFLDGSAVSVDVGPRDLQPEQISSLRETLTGNNMVLRRVIAGPGLGRAPEGDTGGVETMGQQETQAGFVSRRKRRHKRGQVVVGVAAAEVAAITEAPDEKTGAGGGHGESDDIPVIKYSLTTRQPRADVVSEEQTILVQRTIRSGQQVFYPGIVVILGDVNPGGEVVAGGNIIVMGMFRGVAHAGAMGDKRAIVAALRLEPSQLRIAGYITRAPEGDFSTLKQPEIARVQDGVVIIEQYQPGFDRR